MVPILTQGFLGEDNTISRNAARCKSIDLSAPHPYGTPVTVAIIRLSLMVRLPINSLLAVKINTACDKIGNAKLSCTLLQVLPTWPYVRPSENIYSTNSHHIDLWATMSSTHGSFIAVDNAANLHAR